MRRAVRLPLEELRPFLLEVDLSFRVHSDLKATAWNVQTIFGNDHPVEIEVGFGKGLFLVTEGAARPGTNFLGIEIERKYTLYVANRLAKRQLGNVRVVSGDARRLFEDCFPEAAVQVVHVYFPDPWWKNRHRKRRLFTAEFVNACQRVLRIGGSLHLATDVADYFAEMLKLFGQHERLRPLPIHEPNEPQHDLDYLTNFERKYRREGRPIYRALYIKT